MNDSNSLPTHTPLHRARELISAGDSADSTIEQRIERSWRRCLTSHALDPVRHKLPPVVDSAELRRRRASTAITYEIVRAQMLLIGRAFTQSAAIVFTDEDGVILSCIGESSFMAQAQRAGLRVGAVWSESEQGTNGMGTCLVERAPVVVERQAHFLTQHAALSCFAIPILDRQGQLLGALDISSHCVLPREPMLALLDLAVADIERRTLLQQSAGQGLLLFGPRRAHVGTALEGMVSFDSAGLITGANRAALRWLGASAHQDICGKSLYGLFGIRGVDAETLDGSFKCRVAIQPEEQLSYHCRIVPIRASTSLCSTTVPSLRDATNSAERDALLEALQRSDWNITRAARTLRIGRKTLYRKMHRHRLLNARSSLRRGRTGSKMTQR